MRDHLFLASDGDLFDTRDPQWSGKAPLRAKYSFHHADIRTVAQFKAALRAGAYAWPGGYECSFVTSDGAAICFKCARQEARNIFDSIRHDLRDGWRVMACDCSANYDDVQICDHCSETIG